MVDLDTDNKLSDKISEKLGKLINNTSQSGDGKGDTQQQFCKSNNGFFNSIRSNEDSQLKTFNIPEEEMLYHSVVELFPDGIFIIDFQGIIQSCNATAVTLLGYSKDELIGHKFSNIGKYDEKGIVTYLNIFDSIIQGNIINPFELKLQKKDRSLFTAEIRMRLLTQKGKKLGIQVIARKISDIKSQDKKIKESKNSFQRIFSIIPDMISVHDPEMNIIYSNWKGFANIPEEKRILNTKCYKTYRGLNQICPDCKAGTVLNTKESIQTELELPEGIWIDLRVLPLIDENNDVELFVEWVRDITEKKKAKQKITELKDFYEQILENVHDGIWVTDKHDKMIYFNPGMENISGIKAEKVLGFNIYHDFPPETIEYFIDYYKKAKESGKPQQYEAQVVTPTGITTFQTGWLIPRFDNVENYQGMICTVVDITKQKRFQDEIIESKKRLDLALEGGDLGTWDWNIQTDEVHFNHRWAEMVGYQLDELKPLKSTWENLVHPKDLPRIQQVLNDHLHGKTPFYEARFRMKHKFGNYIWILDKGKVIEWDEQGNPVRACGTHLDITHQKQIELALEKSEQKYRLIFEMSPIGITTADKKGRIIDINQSGANITGHSREELIGKKYNEINFIDRKVLFKIVKNHFSKIIKGDSLGPIEMNVVDLQDKTHIVEVRISPIRDNGKFSGTQIMMQDITERKKAEEEIQQTNDKLKKLNQTLEQKVKDRTERINQLLKQKDEFINQLGHDLKNPLGPFLQLLPILENHIADKKDKRMISVLNRNANYMRNLVKKTIDLAKLNSSKTTFSFEDVSLSDLVDEVVAVNSSLFEDHDVMVENNVSSNCMVHADPFHIQEVFTNLFNNAVKYSEDERWIGIDAVEQDDCMLISVRDNGVGISDEQLPFLFDEYYKADSSRHDFDSSGLGLPICKRIVEKHGGRIWAESPGLRKGSTFYFTLPKKVN